MTSLSPVRSALLSVLSLSVYACGGGRDPIVIGVAVPGAALEGESVIRGASLAAQHINAAGGVAGRQVEIQVVDDANRATGAMAAARVLRDDPRVVAAFGHLANATSGAAAPVYNAKPSPLPLITPAFGVPSIRTTGDFVFRVATSDDAHAERLAVWARDGLGVRRVAVFFEDTDEGHPLRSAFVARVRAGGGEAVDDYPYRGETADFEPYALHARVVSRAELVLLAGGRVGAERALATLRATGYGGPVAGAAALAGIERLAATAESLFVSTPWLPDTTRAAERQFLVSYAQAHGGEAPDYRAAIAYDVVHLFARAVEEAGPQRARIQRYLSEVGRKRRPYAGVTGPLAFDDRGYAIDRAPIIGVVRDGRLVRARRP